MSDPPGVTHRLILNVAMVQHELATVATLMSSIGAVVAQARKNDRRQLRSAWTGGYAMGDLFGYDGDAQRMRNPYEDACE